MTDLRTYVMQKAALAKKASQELGMLTTAEKNKAIDQIAHQLWESRQKILEANQQDIEAARAAQTPETRIDRLRLTEPRLQEIMQSLKQITQLSDPIGEVLDKIQRPNGLWIEKQRVPFGLIAMVYESRPNVTIDAVGLAIKTGNAVILRGGREALQSNLALVAAVKEGLAQTRVPVDAVQLIGRTERESVNLLIQAKGLIDLAIPRGGDNLIQHVVKHAQIPVIETGVGNCHVYIHASADPQMAEKIVVNAKTQRPSVCNAMETLLVDKIFADQHLTHLLTTLQEKGVELRGCEKTAAVATRGEIKQATEADYATEHLGMVLSIKVVSDLDEALEHIQKYGTNHSEAIVAEDLVIAGKFLKSVDAAAVYHNVSTRFTDGFEFGFGAEIGISTQKLHARGPMGLPELTSYKYVVKGTGQIK